MIKSGEIGFRMMKGEKVFENGGQAAHYILFSSDSTGNEKTLCCTPFPEIFVSNLERGIKTLEGFLKMVKQEDEL